MNTKLDFKKPSNQQDNYCSIKIDNLIAGYKRSFVLDNLSFFFEGPGLMQVIGPNGSGKSTLLKVLAGIITEFEGSVEICGLKPKQAASYGLIGYVPQLSASGLSSIPITALEVVLMDDLLRSSWPRLLGRDIDFEKAGKILSIIGVEEKYWNKRFSELSGGLKQRVLLARALINEPKVLLLDEIFANVDPSGRYDIACIIGSISSSRTVILTSHDPALMLRWTKKILVLGNGKYLYGSPNEVLDESKLSLFYGSSVLRLGEHVHISDAGCKP